MVSDICSKFETMNNIINKFLLTGDKFMSEIYLRQPGFMYSACEPFTENKTRIQKLEAIGDSRYIYRNELDKGYFQHNTAYGDFKNLPKRTASDKVLRDMTFEIATNPNSHGYQCGLASII